MKQLLRSASRSVIATLTLLILFPAVPALASSSPDAATEEQFIAQLEQRAQQSNPREQCFLYTELVHTMTDIAGRQMLAGEPDKASATLRKVEQYAHLIHINLSKDTKRIKNAEMLMQRTTYQLTQYMHAASSDDRPTLQATLKQLNKVQDEMLTQVFAH